jgi:very-short-patch-repair endonuclease
MRDFLQTLDAAFETQVVCKTRHLERIFDFYSRPLKLRIEVDGSFHEPEKDAASDRFLKDTEDITTLRFPPAAVSYMAQQQALKNVGYECDTHTERNLPCDCYKGDTVQEIIQAAMSEARSRKPVK